MHASFRIRSASSARRDTRLSTGRPLAISLDDASCAAAKLDFAAAVGLAARAVDDGILGPLGVQAGDADLEHLGIDPDGTAVKDGGGGEYRLPLLAALQSAGGFALGGEAEAELMAADSSGIADTAAAAVRDAIALLKSYEPADRASRKSLRATSLSATHAASLNLAETVVLVNVNLMTLSASSALSLLSHVPSVEVHSRCAQGRRRPRPHHRRDHLHVHARLGAPRQVCAPQRPLQPV